MLRVSWRAGAAGRLTGVVLSWLGSTKGTYGVVLSENGLHEVAIRHLRFDGWERQPVETQPLMINGPGGYVI